MSGSTRERGAAVIGSKPFIPCSPLYSTGSRPAAVRISVLASPTRRCPVVEAWRHHERHEAHESKAELGLGFSCHSCVSESAKQSLVVLVNCNVLTMVRDRKPCSRPLSGRGRPRPLRLGKANARAVAFRELGSASLHEIGSGQSAECDEASIGGEASIKCTRRTPRGERRQRARTEPPGTWEARSGVLGQPSTGSHNRWRGRIAASDGLIVVRIRRSSRRGAKEPWPESSGVRSTWN
jgi:hypothetical protein